MVTVLCKSRELARPGKEGVSNCDWLDFGARDVPGRWGIHRLRDEGLTASVWRILYWRRRCGTTGGMDCDLKQYSARGRRGARQGSHKRTRVKEEGQGPRRMDGG